VDGGIQAGSAAQLCDLGVTWAVIGTALYAGDDMPAFVRSVKGAA
jgi:pentose-5-phosphate-3-epimerase